MHSKKIIYLIVGILLVTSVAYAANTIRKNHSIKIFTQAMSSSNGFSEDVMLYRKLLNDVGAAQAQEVISRLLPNDSKSHMLNHETGRFLYEHGGINGVQQCKTYFADSCYHGFISAVLLDRGLIETNKILAACKMGVQRDQQMQCAHGIGHGFLENVGYDKLPKALDLCAQTFAQDKKSAENCYDGVFMENDFGEFNRAPADRWYRSDDPMYPCNILAVLDKPGAHDYCWFMQSQATLRIDQYPHLKGDPVLVAMYCDTLKDAHDHSSCFMGLARQIQVDNRNNKDAIQTVCATLGKKHANQCMWDAAEAAYIYGERDSGIFHVCEIEKGSEASGCYDTLFEAIGISYSEDNERITACNDIPNMKYRASCKTWVKSPAAKEI